MFNLIQNELMKIFKRIGTYVMIGLSVLIVIAAGIFIHYMEEKIEHPDNWKVELQTENNGLKAQLEEMGEGAPLYLEKQLAINEYQIEHNLSPYSESSLWDFVEISSSFMDLAGMFVIIIAGGIVANEFNWGTMKLLLIRPVSRSKLLLSKYMTVVIFSLIMTIMLFCTAVIVGAVLFGLPSEPMPKLLYLDGQVTEMNMGLYMMMSYALSLVHVLMLGTMAFMLSSVFRNSSTAIGFSIFLMFTGYQLTYFVSMKFEWAKYLLFANTVLVEYIDGEPLVPGMTMTFSLTMLIFYFILFQFLAFFVFNRRDVAI
ncbi:ABC transporter permease [Bacillus kexueae]|uniref:ABC transporter permease n=1 Tax=Aeribacillus kexueae TaxID=2078952 RepID=UPI001FAFF51F|nr:ABC transporter permease [Bacillus kexueae]